MSERLLKSHAPCPCGDSSDGYSEWDDHGYCFGQCGGKYFPKNYEVQMDLTSFSDQYVPWRGLTRDTMEFFHVTTKVSEQGEPVALAFPWPSGRVQIRQVAEKKFHTQGEVTDPSKSLFGMNLFPAGGRAITIHEGALDAMSGFQIMGSKYPFVSVSSSSTAKKDCTAAYEYINSFEKIYLAMDMDGPGQEAARSIAELFDFNKVYVVKFDGAKDANELLEKGRGRDFVSAWYGAKRFVPEGIISTYAEIDKIIDDDVLKDSIPYPFDKLQDMTYGIRTGELTLLKALEGIGKTEIFRAIEYHVLKNTPEDVNVGVIHLEESKARSIKGLAGYELQSPCHLPDSQVSNDEIKNAYRNVVKKEDRLHIYSHFGSDDPDTILGTIRFMVSACNCKYVFLDHITMVVTGLQGEDERKALDYISTRLKMMTQELDFGMFLISHVNDEGQTRGSRNISKVADTIIHLHRNILADDPVERNTTDLVIEKNRFGSKTGRAGSLFFDLSTFTVAETPPSPLDI